MKLNRHSLIGIIHFVKMLLVAPAAMILRREKSPVWLVSERKDQARDNGYCFFRYVREKHPDKPIFYVIEKKAADKAKLDSYGHLIAFNSWKHYFYFCLSKVHISTHVHGCIPEDSPYTRKLKKLLGYSDVFLPHGVSYGISEFCLAKYAKIDLFISCGIPERENLILNYGYLPEQVVCTGFPRMDAWLDDLHVKKNQILLMPTWRLYIAQDEHIVFEKTDYYQTYQSLLNDKELIDFLRQRQLRLVFYLHHEMQRFSHSFHALSENVEIVYDEQLHDIQGLLMESALLITDYSSVHFDFAYMGKPVIYYQFDREEFFVRQYQKSIFDAETHGFGPVTMNRQELVRQISAVVEKNFQQTEQYKNRLTSFFLYHDQNNCKRVFEVIQNKL